jgi:hypothetical protein
MQNIAAKGEMSTNALGRESWEEGLKEKAWKIYI